MTDRALHRTRPSLRVLRLLALAAALAGAAACGEGSLEPRPGEAVLRGTWGGTRWEGDASATLWKGDTLYVYASSPRNAGQLPLIAVRVKVALKGTGSYELGKGAAEVLHLVGGDAVTASYETAGPGAGVLHLREYDGEWVAGSMTFDAALKHGPSQPKGEGARFTGEFRARVRRYP